ncbi:unnamed protein product [Adineta ricciae]|uniref:Uncharacterized protein n=1 Tax=Adineta ricciae TaxID=249248 RepID=A0A813VIS7_ADIRI|nr:unnamed protein product [Adineta ricciae]CAF1407289.1 unnamed protein product [Adineta ricciae]
MLESSRFFISISLFLITLTLIFHFVAMGYPRWKASERRTGSERTITVGIFQRCENQPISISSAKNKSYPICDDNKYIFPGNKNCRESQQSGANLVNHRLCHQANNPCQCDYSSIAKGLISCTIIAACTLSLSFLLIFSHIIINPYKYQFHLYITVVTVFLLLVGLIFIFVALILLGSSLNYDLYQYHYDLRNRLEEANTQQQKDEIRANVTTYAAKDFHTRLDWAAGLEIIALFFTGFTLMIRAIHLVRIYRNRNV